MFSPDYLYKMAALHAIITTDIGLQSSPTTAAQVLLPRESSETQIKLIAATQK